MDETGDHDVTDPGLCGDVVVHPHDKVAVSGQVEPIDIWGHMTGHAIRYEEVYNNPKMRLILLSLSLSLSLKHMYLHSIYYQQEAQFCTWFHLHVTDALAPHVNMKSRQTR